MFQAAWSKPLKVHRGLGNSYIQIHSLMKFWQSSSAQSLDNNPIWQAQFWATLPQTGPKLGRPRDRNSSWGVTNRFLSSDLCSAPMDSEQVDWPKETWLSNKCNRGARGPSMWWGSAGQSFYLRFVSSPMGFVSKSRSVCPHTTSGNDPGASFVSCTEGPAHESWISLDLTDTYLKMTICRPWQLIFFDHCRVRLWSDQQVNSFDITLAVLGKQHELCNLLKGKILSLKRYFGFQHFEAFWNQRLLHFKKCSASSRQWPSHTLRVPSNTVVTVTPTREGKHLRSQPQSTFHQNQAKSVCSQWSSINILEALAWLSGSSGRYSSIAPVRRVMVC